MKTIYTCLIVVFFSIHTSYGQISVVLGQELTSSKVISGPAINKIFNKQLKSALGIRYPVRKGYYNKDKTGEFYFLLAESFDGLGEEDTLHKNIQILKVTRSGNQFVKTGEINDRVLGEDETSIWIWSRYCEFKDIDKDGYIDPVLIYGSSALNGISDGRLKIVTWYKGQKVILRHQNGTLDDERNFHIDPAFYRLPLVVQKRVRLIMKNLGENTAVIFPWGWEKKMDKKKLFIQEAGS